MNGVVPANDRIIIQEVIQHRLHNYWRGLMWAIIKLIIVTILILIVISYFGSELRIIILKFTFPELLIAIGTIGTAVLSFYFGIFGNRQTKILLAEKENKIDREAFVFLSNIPLVITGAMDSKVSFGTIQESSREFISHFEDNIINESMYLSQTKIKQYNRIIKLANDLTLYPVITSFNEIYLKRRKLFYKIKDEAEKLSCKANSKIKLQGMQNLWDHEAHVYWENYIYLIQANGDDEKKHDSILFYSMRDSFGESRSVVDAELKKNGFISEDDDFYLNISRSDCEIFWPTEYELIARKQKKIIIIYRGEKITLSFNKPISLKRLG